MSVQRARVCVLYTGGTLGMVPRERGNPASALTPGTQADLARYLPPDLGARVNVDYDLVGLRDLDGGAVPPIDSSDVTSEHWKYIAQAISSTYDDYDGFIVLHGTDTMAYTSSALSFMLENLAKPVVLTGAQLPISHPRTDAVGNFVNALHVAGHEATGVPLVAEVTIVFGSAILRGNRARKLSSSAWQGFDSPNHPRLGTIGEHIDVAGEHVRPPADNEVEPCYARLDLEPNIADIGLFPGIQPEQLAAVLLSPGLRGAVLRTYGAGNAPSSPALLDVISRSVDEGRVVVNVTQCTHGMVEAGLYESGAGLLGRGVTSGLDLTPEAALTKLMSLLANESIAEARAQMQLDLRGEQSADLLDVRFGAGTAPAGRVTAEASLPGRFDRDRVRKATLRVRGLAAGGEGPVAVEVYVNHPRATATSTPRPDPRRAATFTARPGAPADHVADVTDVARRVLEDGRAVQLTFVAPDGAGRLDFAGASLALLLR